MEGEVGQERRNGIPGRRSLPWGVGRELTSRLRPFPLSCLPGPTCPPLAPASLCLMEWVRSQVAENQGPPVPPQGQTSAVAAGAGMSVPAPSPFRRDVHKRGIDYYLYCCSASPAPFSSTLPTNATLSWALPAPSGSPSPHPPRAIPPMPAALATTQSCPTPTPLQPSIPAASCSPSPPAPADSVAWVLGNRFQPHSW